MTPEETELYCEVLRAALLGLVNAVESKRDVARFRDNAWLALDWSPEDDLSIDDHETARKKAELKAAKRDISRLIDSIASRAINHVPISPVRMMRILGRLRKWLANPERHWNNDFFELTNEANNAMNEFHHAAFQVGVFEYDLPF